MFTYLSILVHCLASQLGNQEGFSLFSVPPSTFLGAQDLHATIVSIVRPVNEIRASRKLVYSDIPVLHLTAKELSRLESRLIPGEHVSSWRLMAPWRVHLILVNSRIAKLVTRELSAICDSADASMAEFNHVKLQSVLAQLRSTVTDVRNVIPGFLKAAVFTELKQAIVRSAKTRETILAQLPFHEVIFGS